MSVAIHSPRRLTNKDRARPSAKATATHGKVWNGAIGTVMSTALACLLAVVLAWILVDLAREAVSQSGALDPFDLMQFFAGRR